MPPGNLVCVQRHPLYPCNWRASPS